MAKYIAQIVVLGSQLIGRAFVRAIRQEYAATQAAAQNRGGGNSRAQTEVNIKSGITIDEAKQILNINKMNSEEIQKNFDHLFEVNDKSKGGSFYLQSKVVRAKERLDAELLMEKQEQDSSKQQKNSQ